MIVIRYFSMLADVFLRLRHARGMSQVAVARRAGFNDTQVSRWERGQTMPDLDSTLRMLDVFGYRLVVMPAAEADVMPLREAVIEAATAIVLRDGFDGRSDALHRAVTALVEAEARR